MRWRKPEDLDEIKIGEVVMISHNRETWIHNDPARNNCVVVTRRHYNFREFGPGAYDFDEVTAWARFSPPPVPRRPLDEDKPGGYLESDLDFVMNNLEWCVDQLEQNT